MSKEQEQLELITEGLGDIEIKVDGKNISFPCKPNRFTDLILADSAIKIYEVFYGNGDNEGLEATYKAISAMSRAATDTGKPLVTPEQVNKGMSSLQIRGCMIILLSRYSEMIEELGSIIPDQGKKKRGKE